MQTKGAEFNDMIGRYAYMYRVRLVPARVRFEVENVPLFVALLKV